MTRKHDAIIIGTGQSGPSLAARLAATGLDVAVIERKLFGGTCVNTGCIPTKTLVASARAAYMARRGQDFGVVIDGAVTVDMKAVKERKDRGSAKVESGSGELAQEHEKLHGLRRARSLRGASHRERR